MDSFWLWKLPAVVETVFTKLKHECEHIKDHMERATAWLVDGQSSEGGERLLLLDHAIIENSHLVIVSVAY